MGNTMIIRFLYINVFNYRYFYINCSTFLKIKKRLKKLLKNVKNAFFIEKLKKRL